jgi:hypothetical protein
MDIVRLQVISSFLLRAVLPKTRLSLVRYADILPVSKAK